MANIEQKFNQAMMSIYHEASAIGYIPRAFHQMITRHGGLAAAKRLINASKPSDGYTRLWELKRLDISVEAAVHDNAEWHSLFTQEELAICRKRLIDYQYLT